MFPTDNVDVIGFVVELLRFDPHQFYVSFSSEK